MMFDVSCSFVFMIWGSAGRAEPSKSAARAGGAQRAEQESKLITNSYKFNPPRPFGKPPSQKIVRMPRGPQVCRVF